VCYVDYGDMAEVDARDLYKIPAGCEILYMFPYQVRFNTLPGLELRSWIPIASQ